MFCPSYAPAKYQNPSSTTFTYKLQDAPASGDARATNGAGAGGRAGARLGACRARAGAAMGRGCEEGRRGAASGGALRHRRRRRHAGDARGGCCLLLGHRAGRGAAGGAQQLVRHAPHPIPRASSRHSFFEPLLPPFFFCSSLSFFALSQTPAFLSQTAFTNAFAFSAHHTPHTVNTLFVYISRHARRRAHVHAPTPLPWHTHTSPSRPCSHPPTNLSNTHTLTHTHT